MSNLDTTLRENEEELKLLMGAAALDFADLSEKEWEAILAYITKAYKLGRSEFHQLLNEKREAIEALAKRKHDDIPSAIEYVYDSVTEETEKVPLEDCSSMEATCYNAGLKDALSILND